MAELNNYAFVVNSSSEYLRYISESQKITLTARLQKSANHGTSSKEKNNCWQWIQLKNFWEYQALTPHKTNRIIF